MKTIKNAHSPAGMGYYAPLRRTEIDCPLCRYGTLVGESGGMMVCIDCGAKFKQPTKRNTMPVRAKFRCDMISRNLQYGAQGEVQTITLNPVTGGSDENKQFWKWTPSGKIELGTVNAEAAKGFELGKEYYVDFTPAG